MATVSPATNNAPSNHNSPTLVLPAMGTGFVAPMYVPDRRRPASHQPGKLVYSAQFDDEMLKCMYCCLTAPFCCGLEEMAKNTSLDIYTNAVVYTRPTFWYNTADCFCGRQPWGLTRYYDHSVFENTVTDGRVCNPHICALVGWCGKFGEQVNFHNVGCNTCCPSAFGNVTIPGCCQSIEMTYGFSANEARRVSTIINDHARIFREHNGNVEMDPLVQQANNNAAATAGGARVGPAVMA